MLVTGQRGRTVSGSINKDGKEVLAPSSAFLWSLRLQLQDTALSLFQEDQAEMAGRR